MSSRTLTARARTSGSIFSSISGILILYLYQRSIRQTAINYYLSIFGRRRGAGAFYRIHAFRVGTGPQRGGACDNASSRWLIGDHLRGVISSFLGFPRRTWNLDVIDGHARAGNAAYRARSRNGQPRVAAYLVGADSSDRRGNRSSPGHINLDRLLIVRDGTLHSARRDFAF